MNDRELLEAAAKAAGLQTRADDYGKLRASPDGHWWPVWNPLESDGDALRLAAKLGMEISVAFAQVYACRFGAIEGSEINEPHGESHSNADVFAATRRAIVRAAAAIGSA